MLRPLEETRQLRAAGIVARLTILTQEMDLLKMDLGAEDWLQVQRRAYYFEVQMREVKERAAELRRETPT